MKTLIEIAEVLRKNETDCEELASTIKDYEQIVMSIAPIDIDDNTNRSDIHFSNGKALGTTWAAYCLKDLIRTKKFVKGLFNAIENVRKNQEGKVTILYAGTGPFATLILPVMATYSPEEVEFVLMEINEVSSKSALTVIHDLGFDDYIKEMIIADATQYKFESDYNIDIVLSETMQRALEREHQVPIMINLLKQLKKDVIMIPESIRLDLCLLDAEKAHFRDSEVEEAEYCTRIESLFELNLENVDAIHSTLSSGKDVIRFPQKAIELHAKKMQKHNQLAILTEIQVYGNDHILLNESGLTTPLVLTNFDEQQNDLELTIGYKVDEDPGFEFQLSEKQFE